MGGNFLAQEKGNEVMRGVGHFMKLVDHWSHCRNTCRVRRPISYRTHSDAVPDRVTRVSTSLFTLKAETAEMRVVAMIIVYVKHKKSIPAVLLPSPGSLEIWFYTLTFLFV